MARISAPGGSMDVLIDLEWRIYPVSVMAVAGVATLMLGIRLLTAKLRETPADMIGVVAGFRIAVIGVTLVGLAVSWNWHMTWLFVLAVVFGAEEILESTTHLAILRWRPAARGVRCAREQQSAPTGPAGKTSTGVGTRPPLNLPLSKGERTVVPFFLYGRRLG